MKEYYVCQIVDMLSETLPTIFLAPNFVYADKYFVKYVDSLKGADHADFVLFISYGNRVFSSYEEFDKDFQRDISIVSEFGTYHDYDFAYDYAVHGEKRMDESGALKEVENEG